MEAVEVQSARPTPDIYLLGRLQGGDDGAFREIYERHFKATVLIAHHFLGSRNAAEDAVQATFLLLWEKSGTIQLSSGSLMPWLATVCRLQCQNIRRKEWRRNHTNLDDHPHLHHAADSLEDRAMDAALVRSLAPELDSLSETDQEIFRLCLVDDLSYEAAAEALGITKSAVRNRLSRLRTRLRKLLSAHD